MPVGIRVVSKGNPILILEPHEPGHSVRAGAVHTNFAVVINRHERERRVELRIDDADIQFVNRVDRFPVRKGGATERIHCELETGCADRIKVHNVPQILYVGYDKIFLVRG